MFWAEKETWSQKIRSMLNCWVHWLDSEGRLGKWDASYLKNGGCTRSVGGVGGGCLRVPPKQV